MFAVRVDERPQVEVREVVGVARQEELFVLDPGAVGQQRPGAAEQLRLEERADRRRSGALGQVAAHHLRQVVQVDEHLVDARRVEGVEPDVEQRAVVDDQHALRGGVGDRPQAGAEAGREEEGLHACVLRTTPKGAHPRVGLGEYSVQAFDLFQPRRVLRDRLGRRTAWFPAQRPQGADVGQDVAGIAEAVLPGHRAWLGRAVLAHDDVGEFPRGDRGAAADVENPADGPVVLQDQHVGVHDVVDVDVVADGPAVLVKGRGYALQIAQAEDAARARVRVVDRLPRPLDDAVAKGDGRDAIAAAEVDGDHLLAQLRHAVGVLRVRDPLRA